MLAPFINLFIKLGISPDAVTVVGTLGVSAGALVFFPQGDALAGRAGGHRVRLQRPDRRRDGPQDRPHRRRSARSSTPRSTGSPTRALFGGMALFFAWQAEDRLYLVLAPGLPGDGLRDVVRPGQGRAARLQRQDRARRAAGPAGRRCWSRRSSATCSTCRSSTRSRCGCSRSRARSPSSSGSCSYAARRWRAPPIPNRLRQPASAVGWGHG